MTNTPGYVKNNAEQLKTETVGNERVHVWKETLPDHKHGFDRYFIGMEDRHGYVDWWYLAAEDKQTVLEALKTGSQFYAFDETSEPYPNSDSVWKIKVTEHGVEEMDVKRERRFF